jgi:uncharacterized protein YsxB (DUF464 family)
MITVVYWPGKLYLQMDGHAMEAERGQDIVCAAASMLAGTLAENLLQADGQGILRKTPDIYLADGCARIHAEPKRAYRQSVRMIFDALAVGLELLARQHPQRVAFRVGGD